MKTDDDIFWVAAGGQRLHEITFALWIAEHYEAISLLLELRQRAHSGAHRALLWLCQVLWPLRLHVKPATKLLDRGNGKLANCGRRR